MRVAGLAAALLALAGCAHERTYVTGLADLPFSNAVRVGDTVHVAGHLGLAPGERRPPDDPAEEARLLLAAFAATLAEAGATPADLVRVTVYCSDVALYDTFNAAYREVLGAPFPARAFVGSGPLLFGCRFEMTGVAVVR